LVVREDITFDFRGPHQGIFRRIPLSYARDGYEYPHILSGIGVYDDANQLLRTEVSYPSGSVAIKAWGPGAVNTKKTIGVVYHVRRGVLAYADHDELYWNATGTDWNAPIGNAEVYVIVRDPAGGYRRRPGADRRIHGPARHRRARLRHRSLRRLL